jgi:hypothetical protein
LRSKFLSCDLGIAPRLSGGTGSHDVGIGTLSRDEHYVIWFCAFDSISNSKATIHFDVRRVLGDAVCDVLDNGSRIFVVWIFVGKNDYIAIPISKFPELRALPVVPPASSCTENA